MMKTTKVILAIGAFLCSINLLQAQVKIGDNPLDVGANRLLEVEKDYGSGTEFFIITDSLRFGRSISANAYDPNTDALMLKLYGYGLGNFSTAVGAPYTQATQLINTVTSNVFMGISPSGELLEVPLALDLLAGSASVTLRMTNGTDIFGDVSLNPLDSVFATDLDVRTLINQSNDADGDTLYNNEYLREINVIDTVANDQEVVYQFIENLTGNPVHDNPVTVDLGSVFAQDIQLEDSINIVRNELADTAATLRGLTFYKVDDSFTGDRTADGDGRSYDLNFTELDSFNVNESNTINLNASNDVGITSDLGDVNITANDSVNISGILEADNTVIFSNYGSTPVVGNESQLLGVTINGEVVPVSLDSIGGDARLSGPVDLNDDNILEYTVDEAIQAENTDPDSTIYGYDGVLTAQRTMSMNSHDLIFAGTDTVLISSDGRLAVGRGTFTPNSGVSNVMLEVAGDIYAAQVFSSSDERFKKNITGLDGALSKVMSMEGVTYDFRTEAFPNRNFPTTHQLGFIAQDVEKVVPEVVLTNGDGYKAVDYSKLTALLNEAIKEQQGQISAQAELIKTQQAMISAIMDQNASMVKEMANIKSQLENVSNESMSEE